MNERLDHTGASATNIIAFVPRRKRPKVRIAIRADFKLEEFPFHSFLCGATNINVREGAQEKPDD